MGNQKQPTDQAITEDSTKETARDAQESAQEIGGFEKRLEPTRYGDWDVNGRCSDF